jgi:predicted GH43/DUF377 family glycosyl hydrolase
MAMGVLALAKANYEIENDPQSDISERIIFPNSPNEVSGIEDARFVELNDGNEKRYCATYSAFDGNVTFPQMVETKDFRRFRIYTLNGPEVMDKGMALFPRKVNGHYAMLSRQDGENLYLMYSDMLHFWHTKQLLLKPTFPWEFVQIGNCGSPLETEADVARLLGDERVETAYWAAVVAKVPIREQMPAWRRDEDAEQVTV